MTDKCFRFRKESLEQDVKSSGLSKHMRALLAEILCAYFYRLDFPAITEDSFRRFVREVPHIYIDDEKYVFDIINTEYGLKQKIVLLQQKKWKNDFPPYISQYGRPTEFRVLLETGEVINARVHSEKKPNDFVWVENKSQKTIQQSQVVGWDF